MNERISSKKAAMISASAIIAIYSVCFLLYRPTWAINDDPVMAMCVSGKGFTDRPTEYLLYSNILLGIFLKTLYTAVPSVPWYGIYTISVLCVSSTVLLYAMLLQRYSLNRLLFFAVFFSVFGLYGFMHPQFTYSAFMLTTAGVFLFIQRLEEGPARTAAFYPMSVACLCAASLIRINSMALALVLALPSLVMGLRFRDRERSNLKKAGYWAAVVVVFVLATTAYDEYRHRGEGWRYARGKHMAQVEMIDNNKMTEYSGRTKPIFDKLGWGLNDFLIMGRWFLADDEVMSYDRLSSFTTLIKSVPSRRTLIHFALLLQDPKLYLSLLIIVLFCFRLSSERQRDLVTVLLTVVWGLCIIFYLGYFVRLPERVWACILSFVLFVAIYRADSGVSTLPRRRLSFLQTAVAVLLAVVAVVWQVTADRAWRLAAADFRQEVSSTLFSKNQLYFIWASSFPLEKMPVFDSFDIFPGRAVLSSHSLKNPLSSEILKKFSIVKFRDIVNNEKVYHVGVPADMALYGRFIKEHYGIDACFRIVAEKSSFLIFTQYAVTPEFEGALTTVKVPVESSLYEIRILR